MNRVKLLDEITRAGITGSEDAAKLLQILLRHFPSPEYVVRRKNVYGPYFDRAYMASVYRSDGVVMVEVPKWSIGPFRSRKTVSREVQHETHIVTIVLGGILDGRAYSSCGVSISGWNSIAMRPRGETAVA